MKYKIWQIKAFDIMLNTIPIEKEDCSDKMYISPDGEFMVFGENEDGSLWAMPQRSDFFELEILEP